jgi:glutamate-5-semialdehyde dehydrogenase
MLLLGARAMDATATIEAMANAARAASRTLARMPSPRKAEALLAAAVAIRQRSEAIRSANAEDMAEGAAKGLSGAMLDRLMLDEARIEAMAHGIETVAALRDPVGLVIDETVRPNGLKMSRVRIPLGVIGIVYESRPNVTADAAALCLKSGNAVILRGGSEARRSNAAIHQAIVDGLARAGAPAEAAQLIETTDRAAVGAMLQAHGLIDIIVPRGGRSLVERVQADARVPVLAHLDGLCHTYIDRAADPAMARAIAVNAKMRRTGVCGAMETLLIDRGFADAKALLSAMADAGCELRGEADAIALEPRIKPAEPQDWVTEYLDTICAVRIVDGVDGAIDHIGRHGSGHTDAIVTSDSATADYFLNSVDSAIVMHNASTQFADGGEFGLGGEIGIATGRLHARGPVALEGLTTYKWVVRGCGQTRS